MRYSFEDWSCSKVILASQDLFCVDFVTWARKVQAYFKKYLAIVRFLFGKLKNWQLAIKAFWQSFKSYRSLDKMFRLLVSLDPYSNYGDALVMRSRAAKHTFRIRNEYITNVLQLRAKHCIER